MIPETIATKEGLQVELWRNKGQSEKIIAQDGDHRLCQEDETRKELCQSLGFNKQAASILTLDPRIIYHEIDAREKKVWKRFLPRKYSRYGRVGNSYFSRSWTNYGFDIIPINVLEEIDFAQKTGLFCQMQIWTPERKYDDPIVVGITDDERHFLIARWGESLLPLKDIFHAVRWKVAFDELDEKRGADTHYFFALVGSLIGIPVLALMALQTIFQEPLSKWWWILPVILLTIPVNFLTRLWLRVKKIMNSI